MAGKSERIEENTDDGICGTVPVADVIGTRMPCTDIIVVVFTR